MMNSVDAAIVQAYQQFDTPADQLLLSGERAKGFVEIVSQLSKSRLAPERVLRRLITMRKKGMACSPKTDPSVMRVSTARKGKEILDEEEAT